MSDTKLPGISRMSEVELRAQYESELGQPVPEDLTTVVALRKAIADHRGDAAAEDAADEPTATEEASEPKADIVAVVHPTLGEREFSTKTWELMGSDKGGWDVKVPKPKDLK